MALRMPVERYLELERRGVEAEIAGLTAEVSPYRQT
jgi:hypothetical protein